MNPRTFATLALLFLTAAPARAEDNRIAKTIQPIVDDFKGKVTLVVKHLETGETFAIHADDPMPTASLIKFPVMVEAYRQAANKSLDLTKPITLKKADMVPGSGILTYHFSDGATFPLVDAIHLMIVYSDNTATNIVVDAIGLPTTAQTMEHLDCPNTKLHSKVFRRDTSIFPDRSKEFGLGSTTANEMLKLLEKLHARKLINAEASDAMMKHMLACDDKDKFPRFLPAGTRVAFKTGSVDGTRTCAGIITTKAGPVAVVVLSKDHADGRYVPDNAGNKLCADVAKAVYDAFPAPPKSGTASTPKKP